eukprot:Skav226976  [mRNA]  locus=scaffold927:40515:40799:- [translate_table: standard]
MLLMTQQIVDVTMASLQVAKGFGAAADRASQAREVFAERGKAPGGHQGLVAAGRPAVAGPRNGWAPRWLGPVVAGPCVLQMSQGFTSWGHQRDR